MAAKMRKGHATVGEIISVRRAATDGSIRLFKTKERATKTI